MNRLVKTGILSVLLLAPLSAGAQSVNIPANLRDQIGGLPIMQGVENQDKMQNLQQRMLQLQACMVTPENKAALQQVMSQGMELRNQTKALCAEGKTTQANAFIRSEGKKIIQDPQFKQMQNCLDEIQQGAEQPLAWIEQAVDNNNTDICAQLQNVKKEQR